MKRQDAKSYRIDIFVAGEVTDAKRICRQFCMEVGLCVTVEPTEFIYTGGAESGVRVGVINYPRFPSDFVGLWEKAERLALRLLDGLCQWSVLLEGPEQTVWITTRDDGGQ